MPFYSDQIVVEGCSFLAILSTPPGHEVKFFLRVLIEAAKHLQQHAPNPVDGHFQFIDPIDQSLVHCEYTAYHSAAFGIFLDRFNSRFSNDEQDRNVIVFVTVYIQPWNAADDMHMNGVNENESDISSNPSSLTDDDDQSMDDNHADALYGEY